MNARGDDEYGQIAGSFARFGGPPPGGPTYLRGASVTVESLDSDEAVLHIETDDNGEFMVDVSPGQFRVTGRYGSGHVSVDVTVAMHAVSEVRLEAHVP